MATDGPTTSDDNPPSAFEAELLESFEAFVGLSRGACARCSAATREPRHLLAPFGLVPVIAWLAVRPSSAALWTSLLLLVTAMVLWIVEQIAVKRAPIRPPGPAFLVRGFVACSCAGWLGVALSTGLLVTALGSLRMAGTGMMPALEPGERVVYHKQVDRQAIKPGAIVIYRNAADSAWGQPGWIMISRILAGPGDSISITPDMWSTVSSVRLLLRRANSM